MKYIEHLDELNELLKVCFVRGTLTNCYFLAESFNKHIADYKLSYVISGHNLVLLLNKIGFYQLYFYLNDLSKDINISINKPIVIEILYRGEKFKPLDIINYWTLNNFKQHLTRDVMVTSFENLVLPEKSNSNIVIDYAFNENEVVFAEKLFRNSLDIYTGDLLSMEEIKHYASKQNILIAMYNNKAAGVLQFEVKNKIVWLRHLATDEKFRGKGIANELVRKWLLDNQLEFDTKYQLWVIQDNEAAVKLYRKFGFVYGNKSSMSLLKD